MHTLNLFIDKLGQRTGRDFLHFSDKIILLGIISKVCLAGTLIKTDRHVNHDDETSSVPLSVKLRFAMVTALLPSNASLRIVPFLLL